MATESPRDATWKALESRWERLGYDELEPEERECIALFWLEGEVMNGGLIQYFSNSSGDLAPLAVFALARLGALRTLRLLESAMQKLSTGAYPVNREERNSILWDHGLTEDPFDDETNELQALPEDFFGLSLDALESQYARGRA
jgi:hypothetical protein